ncbi:MAG: integrase [Bacteroidetes bacterium GWE2_29_8]|nr:MAG: integrase [Bacteroidetes bacterium GWE2_29_8]OFY24908.1 MAG: integrase [Bacteroidetes bacterium GWF2_29_10]
MIVDNFLQYLLVEKRYSINTIDAYRNDLMQFVKYSEIQYNLNNINEANHLIIRSWLASLIEKGEYATTVKRKISSLKTFFKYLLKNKMIDINPMVKIISPKAPKRLTSFLEQEATYNLFENVHFADDFFGVRDLMILELFYVTGMRVSELCNIKDRDIDFDALNIKLLGKRNKERIVPLSKRMVDILQNYRNIRNMNFDNNNEYLVVNKKGENVNRTDVYKIVRKYLTLITTLKKKSPHVLRHTFATHMLNNGSDINAIKEILGHTSLAATQIYTHNTIENLKKVYKKAHPKA